MRLPDLPTSAVIDHVNETYFATSWNAPNDHGRANFLLEKAAQRLSIGAVPINLSVVGLPTTDTVYAVYKVPSRFFGRFVSFKPHLWIKDTDVLKDTSVSIITYTVSGRVIPSGVIYLSFDPYHDYVLIAIPQYCTSKCTGSSYPNLAMTVYFDTSRSTPVVNQFYQISDERGNPNTISFVTNQLQATITRSKAQTFVYINGYLYDNDHLPSLNVGDIVFISTDPDIVGYCDVLVDDNQTGYYSNAYQEYREILHISKSLNPNDLIITHDTLTLGIFNKTTYQGVYGHRLDPNGIEAITHNDFSISRQTLQAFQTGLNAQQIFVRIYVRYATRSLLLTSDVNHLEDLYSLTDYEIKQQLIGTSLHQLNEWKASYLEQSSFLDLIYRFTPFIDSNILTLYNNALGYYNLASTLSQTMHYHTYRGGVVQIEKPKRLYGYPCDVMVYANGRKVNQDLVEIVEQTAYYLRIAFKPNNYTPLNTRLALYVTEDSPAIPKIFTVQQNNRQIVLDSDDYNVIQIYNYQTAKPVYTSTVTKGYRAITQSPGDYQVARNNDGTATYTFSANHIGKSFYLMPAYGLINENYSIDHFLNNKESIVFPLYRRDSNNILIPLIGAKALEIYLNGYRLVEGIDYTLNPLMGDNNDILQMLLVISNQEYLELNTLGNNVEVIAHGDVAVSVDKGYVIQNYFHRNAPPMIWSKSCGRAFANGLIVENVNEIGNTLVSSEYVADGSFYLLEWTLPYSVAKLLKNISPTSDFNLRTRITQILNLTSITYPQLVLINDQYALYSPYLAQITHDVSLGLFAIVDDPQDDLFLRQFNSYSTLYERDPLLNINNNLIDRRYVTLAAHYVNLPVNNPKQMKLIQRLVDLTLAPAKLSIDEVLL